MKIVCECGAITDLTNAPLIKYLEIEKAGTYIIQSGDIEISADDLKVSFNCKQCSKSIWIIT